MSTPEHDRLVGGRRCNTMPVHRRLLNTSQAYLRARARIESAARSYTAGRPRRRAGVTRIPVVVHVVHYYESQDISREQVDSQLAVLNRDFRMRNPELQSLPPAWRPLVGDAAIEFFLAQQNPDGRDSDGITRTQTDTRSFTDDDAVKFSARNGVDIWPPDRYLNIWVCPLGDSLGYAQFPGGPSETDGVVINFEAFGTTGTALPPYDGGRTATHEIGHWLNLYHIWGDDGTGCAGTDNVDDTPNQAGPNTGAPTFPSISCDNGPDGDLFVNFMDYTDDPVMAMFTAGQVTRMHATLDGPRSSFVSAAPPGDRGWRHVDLTSLAQAPPAAGDPWASMSPDGTLIVLYRGVDGHIHELLPDSDRP